MDFDRMLSYAGDLDLHNDREWFHENHKTYEGAKGDFKELLELLRFSIIKGAPDLSNDLLYMDVKDWMFRTARDMRINRNQLPYNPSFRAYISKNRKSWKPIGYFLKIFPGENCFGTGAYCFSSDEMYNIRRYISNNYDEFLDIVQENNLLILGNSLKNVPKEFDKDDPAAYYIKKKNWDVIEYIPDERLNTFQDFSDMVIELVKRMEPMRKFLLAATERAYNTNDLMKDFYSEM